MTASARLFGTCHLTAVPSLSRRPVKVQSMFADAGGEMFRQRRPSACNSGRRKSQRSTSLPGNISSQYVSALLHIAPFAPEDDRQLTTHAGIQTYVMMTLEQCTGSGLTRFFRRKPG